MQHNTKKNHKLTHSIYDIRQTKLNTYIFYKTHFVHFTSSTIHHSCCEFEPNFRSNRVSLCRPLMVLSSEKVGMCLIVFPSSNVTRPELCGSIIAHGRHRLALLDPHDTSGHKSSESKWSRGPNGPNLVFQIV